MIGLSKLINSLKGVSSRYLHAEYTGHINRIGLGSVFWSASYYSGSPPCRPPTGGPKVQPAGRVGRGPGRPRSRV
ncbi:transposase [Kitasatospora sp. NPDC001159]